MINAIKRSNKILHLLKKLIVVLVYFKYLTTFSKRKQPLGLVRFSKIPLDREEMKEKCQCRNIVLVLTPILKDLDVGSHHMV